MQSTVDGSPLPVSTKLKRQNYTRERKLEVVAFYHANNLYKTSKEFALNTRTILRWVRDEEKIRGSRKGSRRVAFEKSGFFPDMEERLHDEYKQLRRKGLKVKGWWFRVHGKQLLLELHPEAVFMLMVRQVQDLPPHQSAQSHKCMPEASW